MEKDDKSERKPSKSILKNSSSFERRDAPPPIQKGKRKKKETQFDEMNIIATLHPADKDYGHMKIEEPKTPYHNFDEGSDQADGVDASLLAERMQQAAALPPSVLRESDEDDDSEDEESPEARAERMKFESKRKAHYNEFEAVKLARSLMRDSDDDDEDADEKADSEPSEKSSRCNNSAKRCTPRRDNQPSSSK